MAGAKTKQINENEIGREGKKENQKTQTYQVRNR